ncbi:MAG TPA: ferritin-like domain-containing protein [Solirubrobacterales bacterium]|nr:ferritin-like domain-containing protein [Solirubrobacterales bacterium]
MGWDRFASGYDRRRGFGRAVCLFLAAFALAATGCGKSGQGAKTDPEKGSDAEILNAALAQELILFDAYTQGLPRLKGPFVAVGREFRAHEQEYANAITKAIRGLGGETEAEGDELDFSQVAGQADFLALAYELENAALATYLDAAPRLFTDAPRMLAASLAAGHAQHLVVLRQALGAGLAESVPEAFESGEEPLQRR